MKVTFVKAARKDNPVCKAGESYFWWKFRYGGKRYSLTRPRPSQLTQSAYYGTVRGLCERIEDYTCEDFDDFETFRDELKDELQNLSSECQDSLSNMPDQLQYAPTGELLQERINACDNSESELDYIDEFDFEEEDFDTDIDETDDPEGYADAEAAHEAEGEARKTAEFNDWWDSAKSELIDAVSSCEV